MLQDAGVPREEGRDREPEDLPEGEIPWHHAKHDPERLVRDVGAGRLGGDQLGREEGAAPLREGVARRGALDRLGAALRHGLSHLLGHEDRQRGRSLAQERAGPPNGLGTLGHRAASPA